jgi:hypothetical protein
MRLRGAQRGSDVRFAIRKLWSVNGTKTQQSTVELNVPNGSNRSSQMRRNGRQPSRRLRDKGEAATVVDAAAVEPQTHRRGGEIFTKADTVTSEMVVSDHRALAGGERDVPTAANGAVEAALWEEVAEEHGSDVLVVGWWSVGGGCVSRHVTGSHVLKKCRKTWDVSREIGDIGDMSLCHEDMSATCAS